MSLIVDQTTHVMANALHRTIANLLQLSFMQLCQQAVSFNSSLKVLGVVCLNVDEGNDIIIKLNDTVERESDEPAVTAAANRADGGNQVKPTVVTAQKFTIKTGITAESQSRSGASGTKKRKCRPGEDGLNALPNVSQTLTIEDAAAFKSDRLNSNESLSALNDRKSTQNGGSYGTLAARGREQLAYQEDAEASNLKPSVSFSTAMQSLLRDKKDETARVNSIVAENDSDAARLPFGGFVRTHRVENLPFSCAQCTAPFDRASKLKEHAMATEHLAYQCTVCSSKFKSWRNVQRHAVHHLSYKPYGCEVCQKGFSRRDHALKHIQSVHHVAPADSALINFMQLRQSGAHQDPDADADVEGEVDADAVYNDPPDEQATEGELDDEKPQFNSNSCDAVGDVPFESMSASVSASASTATSALGRADLEVERELLRVAATRALQPPMAHASGSAFSNNLSRCSPMNDALAVPGSLASTSHYQFAKSMEHSMMMSKCVAGSVDLSFTKQQGHLAMACSSDDDSLAGD